MGRKIDLTGQKYGLLTVIKQGAHLGEKISWICKCDCGTEIKVTSTHLRTGHTQTCGCRVKTHGMDGTPEYRSYASAKARCTNPNDKDYHKYGGRGIEFRFKSFIEFFEELGLRPEGKKSVDRIDVNGHYEVGNVRWASSKEQCRNQRRNYLITHKGRTLTAGAWEEITGLKESTISRRIKDYNWCIECALTVPKATFVTGCPHR